MAELFDDTDYTDFSEETDDIELGEAFEDDADTVRGISLWDDTEPDVLPWDEADEDQTDVSEIEVPYDDFTTEADKVQEADASTNNTTSDDAVQELSPRALSALISMRITQRYLGFEEPILPKEMLIRAAQLRAGDRLPQVLTGTNQDPPSAEVPPLPVREELIDPINEHTAEWFFEPQNSTGAEGNNEVGAIIGTIVRLCGLTQEQAAAHAGVSFTAIERLCRGAIYPEPHKVRGYLAAWGVPPDGVRRVMSLYDPKYEAIAADRALRRAATIANRAGVELESESIHLNPTRLYFRRLIKEGVDIGSAIPPRLARYREAMVYFGGDMTREEIAERMGVAPKTVTKYERHILYLLENHPEIVVPEGLARQPKQ